MKILCAEYNDKNEVAIVPLGDDVLLRNNGDFYIPEFTSEISCIPQLVVRICKLGKAVGERFASRYYDEIGVGVRFYAETLERELCAKGLPGVMAASFDSSAAISGLRKFEVCSLTYEMWINDVCVFQKNSVDMAVGINKLVALAGDFHTLKIGDYLYCGGSKRFPVKAGDCIRMRLEGEEVMRFEIR